MTVLATTAVDNFAGLVMIFFLLTAFGSGIATLAILSDNTGRTDRGWSAFTVLICAISIAFIFADGVIMHGGFMGNPS